MSSDWKVVREIERMLIQYSAFLEHICCMAIEKAVSTVV